MEVRSSNQPPPPSIPSWVVVDHWICRKDLASFRDDGPTSAKARATNGETIRVSFSLNELPGTSRLCVHCPEGRELSGFDTVVAVHGNAVLFRLEINLEEILWSRHAIDYFIYWATPFGPKLSLLPRCYSTEEEIAAAAAEGCLWKTQLRMVTCEGIGLLASVDGQFVAAELYLNLEKLEDVNAPLEGELFRLRSDRMAAAGGAGQWEVKHVNVRGGKATFRDMHCWWEPQGVVSYGSYLCWVDYFRGIVFCDANHENPELQYLPLPLDYIPHGNPCDGWPQASRAVCITKGGTMKFVNIIRSDGMLCGGSVPGSSFTITVFTLRQHGYDDMEWENDATIEAPQIWAMEGYDDLLPRIAPQFPLVSMDDPNIIYFVLKKGFVPGASEKTWVVTLDMDNKKVLSYKDTRDIPAEEDAKMAYHDILCNLPIYPTEFPKYLRQAPSREVKTVNAREGCQYQGEGYQCQGEGYQCQDEGCQEEVLFDGPELSN